MICAILTDTESRLFAEVRLSHTSLLLILLCAVVYHLVGQSHLLGDAFIGRERGDDEWFTFTPFPLANLDADFGYTLGLRCSHCIPLSQCVAWFAHLDRRPSRDSHCQFHYWSWATNPKHTGAAHLRFGVQLHPGNKV